MDVDINVRYRSTSGERRLTIAYELVGAGPPVLYLSGSGRSLADRPNVLDSPLPTSMRVLVPDQRGVGRSGAPAGDWTMADYALDAARVVDALSFGPCHVVGVSFGGMVAQELAIRRPALVQRLVLVATSSGGAGGSSYPIDRLALLDASRRADLERALADTRHDPQWQLQHADLMAGTWLPSAGQEGTSLDPASGAHKQLMARRHHDTWSQLSSIDAPTLICAGRYDGVAPLTNSMALASRIPDARLAIFDAGHRLLQHDQRAWPCITAFLRTGSEPPPDLRS